MIYVSFDDLLYNHEVSFIIFKKNETTYSHHHQFEHYFSMNKYHIWCFAHEVNELLNLIWINFGHTLDTFTSEFKLGYTYDLEVSHLYNN